MNAKEVKFKKGMILNFVRRSEEEIIIKSSNNPEGLIRTYNESLKKENEYSVKFITDWINNGFITIREPTPLEPIAP